MGVCEIQCGIAEELKIMTNEEKEACKSLLIDNIDCGNLEDEDSGSESDKKPIV